MLEKHDSAKCREHTLLYTVGCQLDLDVAFIHNVLQGSLLGNLNVRTFISRGQYLDLHPETQHLRTIIIKKSNRWYK